jgi:hypothetical protein
VDKHRGYAQAARSLQLVPNPSPGCLQGYPQEYELSANSDFPVRPPLAPGASAPYGLVVTERKAAMESFPDFPYVILDEDGVVDRVATQEEAEAYVASMPDETLRYEAA